MFWVIKLITSQFSGKKQSTITVSVAASLLKPCPFCHVTSFHFTLASARIANAAAGKIANFLRRSGGREHTPLDYSFLNIPPTLTMVVVAIVVVCR